MTNKIIMAIINATYKIHQAKPEGGFTIGTSWLINMTELVGKEKYALITAHHVLAGMQKDHLELNWRKKTKDSYEAKMVQIKIRNNGEQLWFTHPKYDVSCIWLSQNDIISLDELRECALPYNYLASEQEMKAHDISISQELYALGYPKGLSSNHIGFPILRSGRIASYPLWPMDSFACFLMDFSVFSGNSGCPVFMPQYVGGSIKIIGMLTQQVVLNNERLEMGIVLHAEGVRDALQIFSFSKTA